MEESCITHNFNNEFINTLTSVDNDVMLIITIL